MKVSKFNNLSNKELADYLRSQGINTLPAEKVDAKACYLKWGKYKGIRIPDEDFNGFDFTYGVLGMSGPTYDKDGNVNGYLVSLDADNLTAVQAVRNYKNIMRLEEYTKHGVVTDSVDISSSHLTCKMHRQLHSLSSTAPKASEHAAFEVKADSGHLITFTKNGKVRPIVAYPDQELVFGFHDKFHIALEDILASCGISYISNGQTDYNPNLMPIQDLFKEDTIIHEGNNRHEAVLRVTESLLKRNYGILSFNEVQELAYKWNQKHCSPPLDNGEFEKQWIAATKFIAKQANTKGDGTDNGNNEKVMYIPGSDGNGEAKEGKILSVLEAKKLHDGTLTVIGTITTKSEQYVLEVDATNRNVKSIKLEDTETLDNNEQLHVVLYDDMIDNVRDGETVLVSGKMKIEEKKSASGVV